MKRVILLALLMPSVAFAQNTPTSYRSGDRMAGTIVPTPQGQGIAPTMGGIRESFQLIAANTPSAPATVFGGDYILSQTCSGYGTLNLQVLGPDGVTYQTVLSKTASDTTGGTGLSLGSYAKVQITVSGTTGCNALLARVPA